MFQIFDLTRFEVIAVQCRGNIRQIARDTSQHKTILLVDLNRIYIDENVTGKLVKIVGEGLSLTVDHHVV
jgi:hypothetical protein